MSAKPHQPDHVPVHRRRIGSDRLLRFGVRRQACRPDGVRESAQTFVTGDRFASILDPFAQRWTVMTRVEDVSPRERDRRLAEWATENV